MTILGIISFHDIWFAKDHIQRVSARVLIGRGGGVNIDIFMFRPTEINIKTTNLKQIIGLTKCEGVNIKL